MALLPRGAPEPQSGKLRVSSDSGPQHTVVREEHFAIREHWDWSSRHVQVYGLRAASVWSRKRHASCGARTDRIHDDRSGNRTNIATSMGSAMIVVGGIRLLGSLIKNTGLRSVIEGSLVAVVCTMGFLINSTVASFWTRAYQRQQVILADIAQHIPSIPHGTTLVLDGVCPYMGPGIVFECHWDVGGALNLLYHDWTLKGDIVIPRLKVEERGLVIRTHAVTRSIPTHGIYDLQL